MLFIFLLLIIPSVLSYSCPAGYDCVSQQICNNAALECAPGLYCPGGNNPNSFICNRGDFCSTPTTKEECPVGHYCPSFTVDPLDCLPGSICGGGAEKDLWYLLVILALGVFIIGMSFWFYRSRTRTPRAEKDGSSSVAVKVTHDVGKVAQFNLSISNVGVSISTKKAKRELLAGATGEFHSGKVIAIMGPSGAGKTTLLNVISGRLKHTSGNIFINGALADMSRYERLVGFVPQEDVMLRILTVRQILEHSAKMRLPATMTWAEKVKVVDEVITTLGLSHIQKSAIGDDINRGISGGERKRVNIGIELVAKPSILFLDEPTTGLDSSSAKDVVSCLHDIARTGITVVAVVHQPRFEILSLCDDLLLLGKGGKTAYMGPISEALPYFKAIGYICPPHLNPADFFIDITSGRLPIDPNSPGSLPPPLVVTPEGDQIIKGSRSLGRSFSKTDKIDKIEKKSSPLANSSSSQLDPRGRSSTGISSSNLSSSSTSLSNSSTNLISTETKSRSQTIGGESPQKGRVNRADSYSFNPAELIHQWSPRARAMSEAIENTNSSSAAGADVDNTLRKSIGPRTGFFAQFWLFFHRNLLQQVQDVRQLLTELVYQILPGLALGYANSFELYTPPIPEMLVDLCPAVVHQRCVDNPVGRFTDQLIFYITMVASAGAAVTAASRFGLEKANFKRERRSGINIYAYFLAKNAYDLVDVVRCALLFLATYFLLGGVVGKFGDWFVVMFAMMFSAYGMGYLISMLTTYNKAVVISVVCCIMWAVTSGLSPTLDQVSHYSVFQIFWWLSYVRWGAEGLTITLAADYPFLRERIAYSFSTIGYNIDNFAMDIGMLVFIGVLWRISAFISLYGVRRIVKRINPRLLKKT